MWTLCYLRHSNDVIIDFKTFWRQFLLFTCQKRLTIHKNCLYFKVTCIRIQNQYYCECCWNTCFVYYDPIHGYLDSYSYQCKPNLMLWQFLPWFLPVTWMNWSLVKWIDSVNEWMNADCLDCWIRRLCGVSPRHELLTQCYSHVSCWCATRDRLQLSIRVPRCQKNYKWRLNPVWHRMLHRMPVWQQWASKG